MPSNTAKLNLYKKNPATDGNDTFNIETMLNENWDKIDAGVKATSDNHAAHLADSMKHIPYRITSGSGDTYDVTLTDITGAASQIPDGYPISFKANLNSSGTGSNYLRINGASLVRMCKPNGSTFPIKVGGIYTVRYNATTGNFILQGEGASGNATASDLLSGKIASVDAGDIVGTMYQHTKDGAGVYQNLPNLIDVYEGMVDARINQDGYIPSGYLRSYIPNLLASNIKNGTQIGVGAGTKITGTFTADASAVASDILTAKTAYVNGAKVTGNMPIASTYPNNNTASDCHVYTTKSNANNQHSIFMQPPAGYYNGSNWLGFDLPALTPINIKAGVQIGGGQKITGTFTSDADATEAVILSGKTAYINGAKVTGAVPDKRTGDHAAGVSASTPTRIYISVPQGMFNWNNVYVDDSDFIAANIKSGVNIFGLTGTFTDALRLTPGYNSVYYANDDLNGYHTYAKGWEQCYLPRTIRVNYPGVVRVSYNACGPNPTNNAQSQIRVNGVPVGVTRYLSNAFNTYSEDISVNAGDIISIWGYLTTGWDTGYERTSFAAINVTIGNSLFVG